MSTKETWEKMSDRKREHWNGLTVTAERSELKPGWQGIIAVPTTPGNRHVIWGTHGVYGSQTEAIQEAKQGFIIHLLTLEFPIGMMAELKGMSQ